MARPRVWPVALVVPLVLLVAVPRAPGASLESDGLVVREVVGVAERRRAFALPEPVSRGQAMGFVLREAAGARALWRATGMTDDDFGKPIVAIRFRSGDIKKRWNVRMYCSVICQRHDAVSYRTSKRAAVDDDE